MEIYFNKKTNYNSTENQVIKKYKLSKMTNAISSIAEITPIAL